MISYEELKEKTSEYRTQIIYGSCLALMFMVGFGTGNAWGPDQNKSRQQYSNYTNNQRQNKELEAKKQPVTKKDTPDTATSHTAQTQNQECAQIKGNISSKNKIYHIPGGAFYERTQAEQCFATEAEAQAAGFKKSSR